jgi:hypothetical protein
MKMKEPKRKSVEGVFRRGAVQSSLWARFSGYVGLSSSRLTLRALRWLASARQLFLDVIPEGFGCTDAHMGVDGLAIVDNQTMRNNIPAWSGDSPDTAQRLRYCLSPYYPSFYGKKLGAPTTLKDSLLCRPGFPVGCESVPESVSIPLRPVGAGFRPASSVRLNRCSPVVSGSCHTVTIFSTFVKLNFQLFLGVICGYTTYAGWAGFWGA